MLMLRRQFLRLSAAGLVPGPAETTYLSKATSKMVPVASMFTKAWPAGQPVPMAVTPRTLISEGAGALGRIKVSPWGTAAAAAAPAKKRAEKRILNEGGGKLKLFEKIEVLRKCEEVKKRMRR